MNAPHALNVVELPLHGLRLIEASAGTGKTWTIAALYLRLILGLGRAVPLLPAQILVLTFTRAATAELRERIRARLVDAATCFRSGSSSDGYLAELMRAYPDSVERQRAGYRLELAAQWMDEAAIHTIDAWCQRMLARFAVGSGSPFAFELIEQEAELIADAVRDYWREQAYALDSAEAAWLAGVAATPQALTDLLRGALGQRSEQALIAGVDRSLPLQASLAELMREMQRRTQSLKRDWQARIGAVQEFLEALASGKRANKTTLQSTHYANWFGQLRTWMGDPHAHVLDLSDAAWRRLSPECVLSAVKPGDTLDLPPALHALPGLREAAAKLADLRGVLITHALERVRERLLAAKRRDAKLGFDDVKKRLAQAIATDSADTLAKDIAALYPVALVDEFQDTDPLQWRMFQRIYVSDANAALLLIGDPKQAIYSFRGADIHTYLAARACAIAPHYTLATNHRATTALVGAVNRLFDYAGRWPGGAFAFGADAQALPFHPVQAKGRSDRFRRRGADVSALTLWLHDDDNAIAKGTYLQRLAAATASEIAGLLHDANNGHCGFTTEAGETIALQPADIAILVRDIGEARVMRAALADAGLRSVYLSDHDSVYATDEASDVLRWLQACAEPAAERKLRAALASATLALPYAQLDNLQRDELDWERMLERFRRYRQIWQRAGVLAMLDTLLHEFAVPARLLASANGERVLTNLLHLAELLQQAAMSLDGEAALVRSLAEAIAAGDEAETAVLRLESDAELIKLITVHKSKGLEYPLVFLPFACTFREVGSGRYKPAWYAWHDEEGQLQLDVSRGEASRERADAERLQEELRLLYVALTRARHACWLGVAALKIGPGRDSQLHKSAFGHLLNGGAPISPAELPDMLARLRGDNSTISISRLPASAPMHPGADSGAVALGPARRYAGPANERWWVASYSALRLAGVDAQAGPLADTAVEETLIERRGDNTLAGVAVEAAVMLPLALFPRGATPGTFLHGLLEWAARAGFAGCVAEPDALLQRIARQCQQRGLGIWASSLSEWLLAFLVTPLALDGDTRIRLADLSDPHAYQPELEFWFAASDVDVGALDLAVTQGTLAGAARTPFQPDRLNGLLKGFIDLVFEHAGRYYVVDYKSNWLGAVADDYAAAALAAAILDNRYDMQYCLYILALHRQLRARLPDYDYDRHVGGAVYLFLRGVDGRGHGVHLERPQRDVIEALDTLFGAQVHAHAH